MKLMVPDSYAPKTSRLNCEVGKSVPDPLNESWTAHLNAYDTRLPSFDSSPPG